MPSEKSKLERVIERRTCLYARKTYDMLTPKWVSPGTVGVPDRIFITRQGLIAFVEFKSELGDLTEQQKRWMQRLADYRCETFVISSEEQGRKFVDLISDIETYARVVHGDGPPQIILPPSVPGSRH